MVLEVNQRPKRFSHLLVFSIQHFLAMIVACITVPLIVNTRLGAQGMINPIPIDATIVSAGVGTLIYVLFTKRRSPVFLSSSFAYVSATISALSLGVASTVVDGVEIFLEAPNLWAIILGLVFVGLIFLLVALIIKFTGTKWIRKLLAPVVIGPVIMTIGISLAGSAVTNITNNGSGDYNLVSVGLGIITMLITALASHYGKRYGKLIPFIIGLTSGYLLATVLTIIGEQTSIEILKLIDFAPLTNLFKGTITFKTFFTIPDFIFLRKEGWEAFNFGQLPSILLIFLPVAFVTMSEHIGDHENLGNIIDRDLIEDPGLSKTLVGDGLASIAGGAISGTANTTYGENVAVIGITKISSIYVIIGAAVFSIIVGFFVPFTMFVETIPPAVVGGISLLLYGFIASSGLKILYTGKVDLNQNRNIFIVAVVLISGIGGLIIRFTTEIKIEPIAVAMILGVVLNLILKEKKTDDSEPDEINQIKQEENKTTKALSMDPLEKEFKENQPRNDKKRIKTPYQK